MIMLIKAALCWSWRRGNTAYGECYRQLCRDSGGQTGSSGKGVQLCPDLCKLGHD